MRLLYAIVFIAVTFPPRIVRFLLRWPRTNADSNHWEPQWLTRWGDRLGIERFYIVACQPSLDLQDGDQDPPAGVREPLRPHPSGGGASAATKSPSP